MKAKLDSSSRMQFERERHGDNHWVKLRDNCCVAFCINCHAFWLRIFSSFCAPDESDRHTPCAGAPCARVVSICFRATSMSVIGGLTSSRLCHTSRCSSASFPSLSHDSGFLSRQDFAKSEYIPLYLSRPRPQRPLVHDSDFACALMASSNGVMSAPQPPRSAGTHHPRVILAGSSARILCVADIRGDCKLLGLSSTFATADAQTTN